MITQGKPNFMLQSLRGLLLLLLACGSLVACSQTPPETTENASSSAENATETGAASPEKESQPSENNTATPEEGWKMLQGEGISISLPEQYEGGSPRTDLGKIEERLQEVAPEYVDRLQSLKENPNSLALVAFDFKGDTPESFTHVNAASEQAPPDVSIDAYLDTVSQTLAQLYTIEEQQVISVGDYEAGKIIGEIEANGTKMKQLFYMIQKEETFWIVTYATPSEEFEQRQGEFEQSIQSVQF